MSRFKQRGGAFVMFIVVLVLGGLSVLLSGLNQGIAQKTENKEQTVKVLAEAKAALIGHALTYAETHKGQPPGYLPCPDRDGDGDADSPCNDSGISTIGFFPWKTLGLEQLRDGNGDCLWYAVSGTYKNSPKQALDNDTNGMFRIKDYKGNVLIGQKPEELAIAVLFSPGVMLANNSTTQSRETIGTPTECSSLNAVARIRQAQNFLEISGAGPGLGSTTFDFTADLPQYSTSGPLKGRVVFNDVVLPITPTDFEAVYLKMSQWVGDRVRQCLKAYSASAKDAATKNLKLSPWTTTMNIATTDAYYLDVTGLTFGHLATPKPPAPALNLANTVNSNSNLLSKWADYPITGVSCFDETQGTTSQDWYWWWWTKWKEQVFISVNPTNAPTPTTTNNLSLAYQDPSNPSNYINVNSSFLVFVAGRRLSYQYKDSSNVIQTYTQVRETEADKSNLMNYLEPYVSNNPSVQSTDTTFFVKAPTAMFNDVICNQDKCFFAR